MEDLNQTDFETIKNTRVGNDPTFEEKIDYIYKTLKAQKRNAIIKSLFKITIFGCILYFVFVFLPSVSPDTKQKIQSALTQKVLQTLSPMIKDLTQDMLKDIGGVENINTQDIEKISKEIIDNPQKIPSEKVQELLKKYPHLKDKISQ